MSKSSNQALHVMQSGANMSTVRIDISNSGVGRFHINADSEEGTREAFATLARVTPQLRALDEALQASSKKKV